MELYPVILHWRISFKLKEYVSVNRTLKIYLMYWIWRSIQVVNQQAYSRWGYLKNVIINMIAWRGVLHPFYKTIRRNPSECKSTEHSFQVGNLYMTQNYGQGLRFVVFCCDKITTFSISFGTTSMLLGHQTIVQCQWNKPKWYRQISSTDVLNPGGISTTNQTYLCTFHLASLYISETFISP